MISLSDNNSGTSQAQEYIMTDAVKGRVKLLSKLLLQQNVMWRLPEWSALWSR